jgi:hypothetical protein
MQKQEMHGKNISSEPFTVYQNEITTEAYQTCNYLQRSFWFAIISILLTFGIVWIGFAYYR